MALVALAYNEFDRPKYCNQRPSLMVKGIIGFRSLSNKFRKFLLLEFATWKDILHGNMAESLSLLL